MFYFWFTHIVFVVHIMLKGKWMMLHVWQPVVVISALVSINKVAVQHARLIFGWVTV